MPVFAGLLTSYTTKRARISSSLACQYSQVYLHPTPPNAPESAAASHASIRRSTNSLHHQTRQNQQQPRMPVFAGLLTRNTTKHARISSSLACQYSQDYLQATPSNATESAAASHASIRRSTYILHHQTRQNQQQPRMPVFAGLLTSYTTKRARISSSLACQYSQVYLQATPPNAPESAAASHASIRRSTYKLHHQTRQNQQHLPCQDSQVYL